MNLKKLKRIITIGLMTFYFFSSLDAEKDEILIKELNAVETNTACLIEGVNTLSNTKFIKAKAIANQKFLEFTGNEYPKTLYYPASGADICFPFFIFPTIETVYAFALEDFGAVSDIDNDRVEGKLPTQWHMTGTTGSDSFSPIRYSMPHRGYAHCYPKEVCKMSASECKTSLWELEGWDELSYYNICRNDRICADLLFRIKHILRGTILSVTKINEFHHVIKFLYNNIERKFEYFKYASDNAVFKEYLIQSIDRKIDILFLKGAHCLLREESFYNLCKEPLQRTSNAMILTSTSNGCGENGFRDGEEGLLCQKQQAFEDPDLVTAVDTDAECDYFAFGYGNAMFLGHSSNLRKVSAQDD